MPRETREGLAIRVLDLQARLDEAEETLRAVMGGEVDAIVAPGPEGDQVYTRKGADETYRVMVQEMAEGALTLALDGLILFSNKQLAAMLQIPLKRVIGARMKDFVATEGRGTLAALLNGSGIRKAELRLTADGVTFLPVYLSVQNVMLDGAACHCVVVTDLSAQKRCEEISAVMEAVPVGVFIAHDADCRNLLGNRTAWELLGVPAGASISQTAIEIETAKTWREVRDGRDVPSAELPMQTAVRTGQPVHDCEFDVLFDDGTSRCWLANAVPLFDENKRSRGAVGVFVDITERKRATEVLEATNAELRNFVYALTHELQDPLRTMLHFTQLLAEESAGKLTKAAEESLARSLAGAQRMDAILKGLLRYWEVTERSGEGLVPVDCGEVLSRTLVGLRALIEESGAVVTSDPLPTMVADDVMMAQVFEDLIANAIKFRSEVTPKIHISAVRGGGRWLFSVRDNGIGVDPGNAERVFGMFSHLPGPGASGTGIGLALCKKAIERHGGRIWVESRPGEGAAFRFTIPKYLGSALPGFVMKAAASAAAVGD